VQECHRLGLQGPLASPVDRGSCPRPCPHRHAGAWPGSEYQHSAKESKQQACDLHGCQTVSGPGDDFAAGLARLPRARKQWRRRWGSGGRLGVWECGPKSAGLRLEGFQRGDERALRSRWRGATD